MYSISFIYKDENIKIETSSRRETLKKSFDWLFKNESKFSNLKIYNKSELDELIKNSGYVTANFHNLCNSGNYLLFNSGNKQILNILKRLLTEIGVDNKLVKTEGFQISDNSSRIKPFQTFTDEDEEDEEDEDRVIPPTEFIKSTEKPKVYVKNPFGCKQEDGTSAICIIGKSGSGKTTSTEEALESMKHEYLLYIPIEGEYTFSQYTGKDFEMSSLGEFMMMAQNNSAKCYTVIFDECHRPITISKLNTDLLQALSSRRNRGGDRFVTMDRSTKRMYTSSTEEFPIPLKEKNGKVLVPDNFGIVCLSSNPSVICSNDDFLNRVDLVVFHESDRDITDLTKLKKLKPSEKNIESIRGLLLSDGKQ